MSLLFTRSIAVVAALLLSFTTANPASAALRNPQVAIQGSGLQDLLNAQGELIDVRTAQQDAGLLRFSTFNPSVSSFSFVIELVATSGAASGVYTGHEATPTLIRVFPDTAQVGWFAVVTFRAAPTRVRVVLFDQGAALVGQATTLGGDPQGVGMYVTSSNGTYFMQDARNPGGLPQILCFDGTGLHTQLFWLAAEDQGLGTGADADFAEHRLTERAGAR